MRPVSDKSAFNLTSTRIKDLKLQTFTHMWYDVEVLLGKSPCRKYFSFFFKLKLDSILERLIITQPEDTRMV